MKTLKVEDMVLVDADLKNAGYAAKELKPCPFCGNTHILSGGTRNQETGNIVYEIFCNRIFECGVRMHVCLGGDETAEQARAEVVKHWNTRS
jgi:Lar family restriction alleviation protein